MKRVFTSVLVAFLILITLPAGCALPKGEGFALYLPSREIPVSVMPALSHVDLADESLISVDDIISYAKETHEIELTAGAYERISKLEVPIDGRVFVACIDRSPVYWGAFWTPISSISFDGVAILKPLASERHLIQLQPGYPSPEFFTGEDPRPNPEILQSLLRAGKLK